MPRGARAGWQRARGACDEPLAYNLNIHENKENDSRPEGETRAIEVPRRERVKRGSTTGRSRRSRSLVITPDLRLTVKEYQDAFRNS